MSVWKKKERKGGREGGVSEGASEFLKSHPCGKIEPSEYLEVALSDSVATSGTAI